MLVDCSIHTSLPDIPGSSGPETQQSPLACPGKVCITFYLGQGSIKNPVEKPGQPQWTWEGKWEIKQVEEIQKNEFLNPDCDGDISTSTADTEK